jgi:hypothetical protein
MSGPILPLTVRTPAGFVPAVPATANCIPASSKGRGCKRLRETGQVLPSIASKEVRAKKRHRHAIKLNEAETAAMAQMNDLALRHGQWMAGLSTAYSDDLALEILNLHNHQLNKHNGYGSAVRPPNAAQREDERHGGALLREARRGLAILIPLNDLLKQFPKACFKFSLSN